jgi:ABC-type dipeptide/oligopeptide/nickel transport system permease subunit
MASALEAAAGAARTRRWTRDPVAVASLAVVVLVAVLAIAAPYIALAPGAAIAMTVLAFNLLGDGLRLAFDPRQGQV